VRSILIDSVGFKHQFVVFSSSKIAIFGNLAMFVVATTRGCLWGTEGWVERRMGGHNTMKVVQIPEDRLHPAL
jgi:hypothetical protein